VTASVVEPAPAVAQVESERRQVVEPEDIEFELPPTMLEIQEKPVKIEPVETEVSEGAVEFVND